MLMMVVFFRIISKELDINARLGAWRPYFWSTLLSDEADQFDDDKWMMKMIKCYINVTVIHHPEWIMKNQNSLIILADQGDSQDEG